MGHWIAGGRRRQDFSPPFSGFSCVSLWQGLHLLWCQLTSGLRKAPSAFMPLDRGVVADSFPLLPISGWPRCPPGALSAFLPPLVPCTKFLVRMLFSCLDPSDTMAFLLFKWTTLFALSIVPCKDLKCSYRFHQDIPLFLWLEPRGLLLWIPGEAFLYNASKALELEPKVAWSRFTSTFLNSEKPRETSACMKGHCSF